MENVVIVDVCNFPSYFDQSILNCYPIHISSLVSYGKKF